MTCTSVAIDDVDGIVVGMTFTRSFVEEEDAVLPELPLRQWTLCLFLFWCWFSLLARLLGGKLSAKSPTDALWMEVLPVKPRPTRQLLAGWTLETVNFGEADFMFDLPPGVVPWADLAREQDYDPLQRCDA